jgi:hypothetical protein
MQPEIDESAKPRKRIEPEFIGNMTIFLQF